MLSQLLHSGLPQQESQRYAQQHTRFDSHLCVPESSEGHQDPTAPSSHSPLVHCTLHSAACEAMAYMPMMTSAQRLKRWSFWTIHPSSWHQWAAHFGLWCRAAPPKQVLWLHLSPGVDLVVQCPCSPLLAIMLGRAFVMTHSIQDIGQVRPGLTETCLQVAKRDQVDAAEAVSPISGQKIKPLGPRLIPRGNLVCSISGKDCIPYLWRLQHLVIMLVYRNPGAPSV